MTAPTHTEEQEQQALISLIIPVYNVEAYMSECLQSALGQTFPHLEILCVDDRGSDKSMAIVEDFARRDPRIRIVRNEVNLGLSGSRNTGMRHARAPFIMFLDSDDACDPTFCEKMYGAIVSTGADLAVCGTQLIYECQAELQKEDEAYYALRHKGTQNTSDEIVSCCDVSAWNKIYRRELLEQYGISFPEGLHYEDSYFFHSYMAQAKTVTFVNEKLYRYRRRAGSIMNLTFTRESSRSIDHLTVAMRLHDYFRQWQLLEKHYARFCTFYLWSLDFALHYSPSRQHREHIARLAADFAAQHLTLPAPLPPYAAERLELLRAAARPKSACPLFCVRHSPTAKRYCFLGLPLYRIKYTPSCKKHYLCGLQFRRRNYGQ